MIDETLVSDTNIFCFPYLRCRQNRYKPPVCTYPYQPESDMVSGWHSLSGSCIRASCQHLSCVIGCLSLIFLVDSFFTLSGIFSRNKKDLEENPQDRVNCFMLFLIFFFQDFSDFQSLFIKLFFIISMLFFCPFFCIVQKKMFHT